MTDRGNFYSNIPEHIPDEVFETLQETSNLKIERILSMGQTTPDGEWYDQERDEWVILLRRQARLKMEGEAELLHLKAGDYVHLPAHLRHRVEWTDPEEVCVWLAIHYESKIAQQ